MRQISPKAVIVGSLFDIIGTQLLLLVLIIVVCAPTFANSGARPDAAEIHALLESSAFYQFGSRIVGVLISVVAGYIAAAIAKRSELLNGALSSVLCIALGVYTVLSGASGHSLLTVALDVILAPLLGMFGGYLRAARKAHA